MARVEVKKLPQEKRSYSLREQYAVVAYHYGYTLKQVQKLPYRDIKLLINMANRIEANRYFHLTRIAATAQYGGKKGEHIKKLLNEYKELMHG